MTWTSSSIDVYTMVYGISSLQKANNEILAEVTTLFLLFLKCISELTLTYGELSKSRFVNILSKPLLAQYIHKECYLFSLICA